MELILLRVFFQLCFAGAIFLNITVNGKSLTSDTHRNVEEEGTGFLTDVPNEVILNDGEKGNNTRSVNFCKRKCQVVEGRSNAMVECLGDVYSPDVMCVCMDFVNIFNPATGLCEDCDCGWNGKCSLTQNGNKRCDCDDGYLEYNSTCKICDCGLHGKCSFEKESKRCTCDKGYIEMDGSCRHCDCGRNGKCSLTDGTKKCDCDDGYLEYNSTCKICSCGRLGKCSFVDERKICTCEEGYMEKDGICGACKPGWEKIHDGTTCKKCDCGKEFGCEFRHEKFRYSLLTYQWRSYKYRCLCPIGYTETGHSRSLKCEASCDKNPCRNGGKCIVKSDEDIACDCPSGFFGDLCETEKTTWDYKIIAIGVLGAFLIIVLLVSMLLCRKVIIMNRNKV